MGVIGCSVEKENTLIIATSANMQYTLQSIVHQFEKFQPGNIELVIGSSGNLYAQIEQGAPFDLFVAANSKYPERLFEQNLAEKPVTYAYGKLILWTMHDKEYSLEDLSSPAVTKIGIPNPKTAPYGESAVEVLINSGIYNKVKEKLVYSESVSQVNQYITSGSVDAGFTSLSVIYAENIKNKGNWRVMDNQQCSLINQKACILTATSHKEKAKTFLNYLLSEETGKILTKNGYKVPKK